VIVFLVETILNERAITISKYHLLLNAIAFLVATVLNQRTIANLKYRLPSGDDNEFLTPVLMMENSPIADPLQ
jgi:ABC-type uncharacterized transport system permease subunit